MNTFCGEQITELIGQLAIFLIERIGAAFQYRHAHAEAMKHLGEFYAYRAAASRRGSEESATASTFVIKPAFSSPSIGGTIVWLPDATMMRAVRQSSPRL